MIEQERIRWTMSEIEADPVHVATAVVSENGYVRPGNGNLSKFGGQKVVWAPFEDKGQLHTTKFNEQENKHETAFVQEEGSLKIGSREWEGDRVVVIVLDEERDE